MFFYTWQVLKGGDIEGKCVYMVGNIQDLESERPTIKSQAKK